MLRKGWFKGEVLQNSAWKLIYPCLPLKHCQAVNVCSDVGVTECNLGVYGLEETVHQDKAEARPHWVLLTMNTVALQLLLPQSEMCGL